MAGEADVRIIFDGGSDHSGPWLSFMKEGEIRIKDVSFLAEGLPQPLSGFSGNLVFSPEKLECEQLAGQMGTSSFLLSGVFSRSSLLGGFGTGRATAAFHLSSANLDLDALLPKQPAVDRNASFDGLQKALRHWELDTRLDVAQCRYRGLLLRDLKVGFKTVAGRLVVQPLQLKAAGGDLWGEAWIEPKEQGIRAGIKPRVSNMEIGSFLRMLLGKGDEEKIELTGRIHVDRVELEAEGNDFRALQRSLSGTLRLESENGTIHKFNILSKVFSILNISQLFQGRVPDLKTKGLPYRHITARVRVKEGVASTDDFLVDSDAIRITLVGKVNVAARQIDAKIGVHPLVTLDTVLSHLPIAGYILTGKNKAFMSYVCRGGGRPLRSQGRTDPHQEPGGGAFRDHQAASGDSAQAFPEGCPV